MAEESYSVSVTGDDFDLIMELIDEGILDDEISIGEEVEQAIQEVNFLNCLKGL